MTLDYLGIEIGVQYHDTESGVMIHIRVEPGETNAVYELIIPSREALETPDYDGILRLLSNNGHDLTKVPNLKAVGKVLSAALLLKSFSPKTGDNAKRLEEITKEAVLNASNSKK